MKISEVNPPRVFNAGPLHIRHCANVDLDADEQVTFVSASGTEYDIVRKSWGYYATPSLNGRLREHGLRAALVRNAVGKSYVLLVEAGREADFEKYLRDEKMNVICWLDKDVPALR